MTVPRVCLVILDGWGLAEPGPGNAISLANTPVFDDLWARHPHNRLTAMGESVGLPAGQMGNSEVGHLNLGAGSIVPQDLVRIDLAVRDGSLAANETLLAAMTGDVRRVHLIGLVSHGGVHSAQRHVEGLVKVARDLGVADLVIHAFTDGRDTAPTAGVDALAEVESWGFGRVGSVVGRYYAMDRDKRWERTQRAYDLLIHGRGDQHAPTGEAAVRIAYDRGETDEFVTPTTVGPDARIDPERDSVISFNFRPDRMRQITRALAEEGFKDVDRRGAKAVKRYVIMTEYMEGWAYPALFPPKRPDMTIARVLADRGLRQLHAAETEKYPHVTFFFNGGEEEPYPGEVRELAPSPRDVPTYDHKPEMSAPEVTEQFLARWNSDDFAFAIINYANTDMVGHTGVIPAAVRAAETVDECLGRVVEAVHAKGGAMIVTADHGNADHMLEPDGSPNTAHSLNKVPVIVTAEGVRVEQEGILADVAPTALKLLGIEQPSTMTGRSLV